MSLAYNRHVLSIHFGHDAACLQMSYELLYDLNEGMDALVTGPNTDPTTLANALTVLQTSLVSLASTNATIAALDNVMVLIA